MAGNDCLVKVENLKKKFNLKTGMLTFKKEILTAVNTLNFSLKKGETLGLAGESGCGKTTTGKMLVKLLEPSEGKIFFNGEDITEFQTASKVKSFRRKAQFMFQNPFEALNPRFTIYRSLLEPLIIHDIGTNEGQRKEMIEDILEGVNLTPPSRYYNCYPHELSGGELQRVGIARALILNPDFLVADEPVSMLDVSVRASVLNILQDKSREMGLTTVYISHDLTLIQYMCEYVAIMYLGKIVEKGRTEVVLQDPQHPYTRALLNAVLLPDPESPEKPINISQDVPDPIDLPEGCLFEERCPESTSECLSYHPESKQYSDNHMVACHLIK